MFQRKTLSLLLLLFLLKASVSYSQIVASTTVGCAPLSVQFNGPSGATNILWNLGNSIGTSTLANPNPIYNNPGTYVVTYTALVNSTPVNYNITIQVNPAPSAAFTYTIPPTHCAPMTVSFSGSGGSPGSTYNWAFGDLSTQLNAAASVTHVYGAGSFSPVMTMLDAASGCTAVAVNNTGINIKVSNLPIINISSSAGFNSCTSPFTPNISGSLSVSGSPVPGPFSSINWQFNPGNPASSNNITPGAVTFNNGTSVISLTLTDNNSCSNSGNVSVSVLTPTLNAPLQPTICAGTSFGAVLFSSQPVTYWNFSGNSTPITVTVAPNTTFTAPPFFAFSSGGLKSYTVTINNGFGCQPSVYTNTVFVEEILVDFTLTPNVPHSSCSSPFAVTYINTSTINSGSSLTFTWISQPPTNYPAYISSPLNTVVTTSAPMTFTLSQGSQNPYTIFQNFGSVIGLMASSNSIAQCQSTMALHIEYDTLRRATARFIKNRNDSCAPMVVTFTNTSVSNPNHAITSFTFYNGGSPTQSVSGSPTLFPITFTYSQPGTYYPYMVVKTIDGCVETSYVDTITVVNPPAISGAIASTSACAGQSVTISMSATAISVPSSSTIAHWHVQSDNNFFSGCINNPNPSFPFSHIGTHTIGISAYQRNCRNTAVLAQSITIVGPYGKFRFKTTCVGNKKTVDFAVNLQDVQTATLNFGDGNSDVISGSIGSVFNYTSSHTYSASGNYTATLVSYNGLNPCPTRQFSLEVKVREPNANILFNGQPIPALPNALTCVGKKYNFSAAGSVDAYVTCVSGYIWNFKTPAYTMPTIQKFTPLFGSPGSYPGGYSYLNGTTPLDTSFFDMAARDTFHYAGTYTISLTIRDENGCRDTETKIFRISSAKPSFSLNPNPVCLSSGSVQIINNTQALQVAPDQITNYVWNFGDGSLPINSTVSTSSPLHVYTAANSPFQTFSVICSATNNVGCSDTTMHLIKVSNPNSNFGSSVLQPCIPKGQSANVPFTANPGFATYSLSFGDPPSFPSWTTTSTFNNVSHNYNTPGTYFATLIVTDNSACKSTQMVAITALGQPTAQISFANNQNKFCLPGTPIIISSSSINATPINNFIWGMGTVVTSGTVNSISNILTNIGIYTVQLNVNISGYCNSSDTALVYVYDPKTDFVLDKNKFCLGDTIHVSLKDSSGVYGWKWYYGDNVPQIPVVAGTASAIANATTAYVYNTYPTGSTNGTAVLSLEFYGPARTCVTSQTTDITVIDLKSNFIERDNLYRHCLGPPNSFIDKTINTSSVSLEYFWNFGNGLGTASGANSAFTFTQAGVYPVKLNVTAPDYGCKNSTVKNMTVLPLPLAGINLPDSTCPGSVFQVVGSGTPGVSGALTGTVFSGTGSNSFSLNANNSFSINSSALVSSVYTIQVTDDNSCISKPSTDYIFVQQPAPKVQWDTTIVIGQTVQLNARVGSNFTYSWTPQIKDLNCISCYNPVSTTTDNISYSVTLIDQPLACFVNVNTYKIVVNPLSSLDVPTAFTPNGDGTNDVIYPGGWGLKKLNYFKVFNRWGQLLFESNDLKTGWDGLFNGVPQNMETYVYQVSVESFKGETLTKTGTFKLIR
ncbi:MAG: PKD domain-containing protein [Bacteroidia bacterium]|nr:PKD domain-containing protein [Bacteroidia bacterium]